MRMAYLAPAITLLSAGAFAASANFVSPAKLITFKDWTVGCDNGLACQAVALNPLPGLQSDQGLPLVVSRGEGLTAGVVVTLTNWETKATRYRIAVDGGTVVSGAVPTDSDFIRVEGVEAVKLARAMTKGRTLKLLDGGGGDLGSASLSGVSAALRYIDTEQGRAGSSGAIVATGRRKSTVKRVSLPVITAPKITPGKHLPDASALVALSESSPCTAERMGSTEDSAYSLGSGPNGAQALILLNCGSGAYNASSGVYVGQSDAKGKWTFAPAKFDYAATGFSETSKIPIVINADWNAATQSVSSYSKGRGLGDCGSSETYVWDGTMFRLSGAARMDECRGSLDWINVWRAEVRLTP